MNITTGATHDLLADESLHAGGKQTTTGSCELLDLAGENTINATHDLLSFPHANLANDDKNRGISAAGDLLAMDHKPPEHNNILSATDDLLSLVMPTQTHLSEPSRQNPASSAQDLLTIEINNSSQSTAKNDNSDFQCVNVQSSNDNGTSDKEALDVQNLLSAVSLSPSCKQSLNVSATNDSDPFAGLF